MAELAAEEKQTNKSLEEEHGSEGQPLANGAVAGHVAKATGVDQLRVEGIEMGESETDDKEKGTSPARGWLWLCHGCLVKHVFCCVTCANYSFVSHTWNIKESESF